MPEKVIVSEYAHGKQPLAHPCGLSCHCIKNGVLIDDGTGIGKTYAYLAAGAAFHRFRANQDRFTNSRRTVYIMDGLYQDFLDYYAIQMSIQKQNPGYNPDGYVFCQENGDPYEPRTYQDLFKRCVRQAGIPDANFHSLRHTFATVEL